MRIYQRLSLWLAALLLTCAALAQTLPSGVQKVTSVEGITEYALPNGLHVLLFPDPSKPKVTVNVTYLVGSRHEGYGETGMAHLLEHLMFLQTKTRTNIKQELTDHGAQMNGTTSWDRTNYFETVNASDENLRWALELEADRMVNTRMEKALLDKEMTVVRNEFEAGENNPISVLFQRVLEASYSWHNYGHTPVGNRSDIEQVPIERLAVFYQKYYQPDNAVLTVAGKFDEGKTLQWVSETIGKIPRPQRAIAKTYTTEPVQDGERYVTLRRVGDVQAVLAMYHIPAASSADSAAIEVLSGILGDTPSGRLYKAIVDGKKGVASGMQTMQLHDPGFLAAFVVLRQEQPIEEAKQTLLKTLQEIVTEPPTKEEVERIKTKYLKQIELQMANTQSIALGLSEEISAGDWRLLFVSRDELKKVTEQDVVRVAKAYLKDSNRTLGEFLPTKTPDRAEIGPGRDLPTLLKDYKGGEAISQGESFDPTPANVEGRVLRTKLPNGMKVVLLSKKNRGGTVTAQIGLRFGDSKAVFGKETAANMAGSLLMRGTKNKSRQQIQDEIDRLKAQINVGGGVTSANANIQTVEANLEGTLRLAAELLREPSFPQNEFDQMRQLILASIENARSEPQSLASLELMRQLRSNYQRGDSRYVPTLDEQIEDVKKLTLDDVKKFHTQFYGASNAELVIVGQFDPAAVQKSIAELFGGWKSPSTFERVTLPYAKVATIDRKIETPDKQNALVAAGANTRLAMDDADYPAMLLANEIFGGSFSSRLVHRIRDKEGFSYGVGSSVSVNAKDDGATFNFRAICNPQNAPKVEASFRDELARTLKDGFTEDEVTRVKKALLEQRSVERTQDGSLAGLLLNRERFERTLKFDAAVEAKIAQLTVQDVNEAFRKHIDPAALSFVKGGDFKKAGVLQ